eukprot:TRINITY_DN827_c0_g2_i3.p1 TRINITY_DN827_c0_g2~~TRINITY_DN827_c0_g2_i3.p1  ORF type:complete len:391 (-),score=115.27 TRINITY_DN827_c0_g2_i3:954-2126(-)
MLTKLVKNAEKNIKAKEEEVPSNESSAVESDKSRKNITKLEPGNKQTFSFGDDKPVHILATKQSPSENAKNNGEELNELHNRSDMKNEEAEQKSDADSLKPIHDEQESVDKEEINKSDEIQPLGGEKSRSQNDSKREDSADESNTLKITERQNELIETVKACLKDKRVKLADLIDDKIVIGKNEENQKEYEVIIVSDLVSLLNTLCGKKANPKELEELIKILIESDGNYIIVQNLLELFGESNVSKEDYEIDCGDIAEEVKNLDSDSTNLLIKLISYLEENDISIEDLVRDIVYQQTAVVESKELELDVIDSEKFYELLKELKVTDKPNAKISELFCIDPSYPELFMLKRLTKMLEYVKASASNEPIQEENEEGKDLCELVEVSEKNIDE